MNRPLVYLVITGVAGLTGLVFGSALSGVVEADEERGRALVGDVATTIAPPHEPT
jgi:hypothetical protein